MNSIPSRKVVRMQGYDYSQSGAYFITICTKDRCHMLSDIVCVLKSITAKAINKRDGILGRQIWQRSYYDHIIRNEKEFQEVWNYIENNPQNWESDQFFTSSNNI